MSWQHQRFVSDSLHLWCFYPYDEQCNSRIRNWSYHLESILFNYRDKPNKEYGHSLDKDLGPYMPEATILTCIYFHVADD